MSRPILIGITGRKHHGKDAVADWLTARYGVTKDAFAEPIKQAAMAWFGLSTEQCYGSLKEVVDERWGQTPREIMQKLGTEVARSIHPDVWARAAMKRHQDRAIQFTKPSMHVSYRGTVIADCRFFNEARILREQGGVILYVVRPGLANNALSEHDSERFIEQIGATAELHVLNDGTLEDLQDNVAMLEGQIETLFGVR